ncbi:MAG: hypothetical protein ABI702_08935 [Burkholderiales bacterium]
MISRHRVAQFLEARWRDLKAAAASPDVREGLRQGVVLGAAIAVVFVPPSRVVSVGPTPAAVSRPAARAMEVADFRDVQPSDDVRTVSNWIASSADNRGLPFAVLDKRGARLYVFDRYAVLQGASMVLLGSALGDDTPPGVGTKRLSEIRSHERITPAGRFVSEPGHDDAGNDVVWVDYDAAVALHRVQVIEPKEKRFERIATPFVEDKRISNGCINVPIAFFDAVVKPAMGRSHAVVYVLPDIKPIQQIFAAAFALPQTLRRQDAAL